MSLNLCSLNDLNNFNGLNDLDSLISSKYLLILIISGTKMTNNCLFLWNGSSEVQFFTNI